jgi:hypothetical protein
MTLGVSSCSITKYKAYSPSSTQLNLQMDDLKFLGEVEINVEYRKYLAAITIIDSINGEAYNRQDIKYFPIYSSNGLTDELLPQLQMASAKVLETYPDADYFIVTSQTKEKHQLFLGSSVSAKARIKAYSLK